MISKLENEKIKVEVDTAGAELKKLLLKQNNKNYLWHGDSKYWGRRAPVLFPIVGRLKDNKYRYQEKEYKMTQHGFARDKEFELVEQKKNMLRYRLEDDHSTLEIYPFSFTLDIIYKIEANKVLIKYIVKNKNKNEMYFSIGAHPAFYWPLTDQGEKEDYYLEFEKKEDASRYLLAEGLLNHKTEKTIYNSKVLELQADTFKDDALVFKDLKSEAVALKNKNSDHKIEMEFKGFPYLGIWSQSAEAPFICIEPWQGIADSIDSSGRLEEKEGINKLGPEEEFSCEYSISID